MSKGNEARKPDMAAQLRASLKTEESAIADRFARADTAFVSAKKATQSEPIAPKQQKVVRDTFSMPAADYALISKLRQRCLSYGVAVTKSGIIRAGLHALDSMSASQLNAILGQLEQVKPGRPPEQ